jgi:hypothetical protein
MKKIRSLTALLLLAFAVAVAGCKTHGRSHASVKPYPLDKCVVLDEPLEAGKTRTFVYKGQEVKVCCKDCVADFHKDPEKYMAKINAAK